MEEKTMTADTELPDKQSMEIGTGPSNIEIHGNHGNKEVKIAIDNDNGSAASNHEDAVAFARSDDDVKSKVSYIYSADYVKSCDRLKKIHGRASLVHDLLHAYELTDKMTIMSPAHASKDQLLRFHSEDFIDCLENLSNQSDIEKYDEDAEAFGLCYDCPAFPGVFDYASYIAGATIRACEELNSEKCRVAINWFGGWHHAKKDEADGYCYINDIVLGILKLREKYERVLYIDLDLHHGDGVEDAFCATSKVLTWSLHKLSPGFFPGTGRLRDIGIGKGKFYTVNTPFLDGLDDATFYRVFQRIACKLKEQFNPKAVVLQLGADGLSTDPCNSFNLTTEVYGKCLKYILNWDLPTLVLGGGGYNFPDTAKCWTYLTSIVLGQDIDDEIPEHDSLMKFGPDYSLSVCAGNRTNENGNDYIEAMVDDTLENLDEIAI